MNEILFNHYDDSSYFPVTVVVMASHCYFTCPSAELFVEFLVSHSAISDEEVRDFKTFREVMKWTLPTFSLQEN